MGTGTTGDSAGGETVKVERPTDEGLDAGRSGAVRADAHGTSTYCKQCHADAMIPYGYGWYGDRYTSPETT